MKKILIILGSSRLGRSGIMVADWVQNFIKTHPSDNLSFEFSDLQTENLPWLDSPLPPFSGKYPEGKVTKWADKIGLYDGFIIITPEYNHGYPAVLKNALDLIYKEWNHKPVVFVSYGASSGGIRAVEQLRQVVIELRMIPLYESVSIPFIRDAFDEMGKLKNPDRPERALQALLKSLSDYLSPMTI